jgi:hypothetical protein
MIWVMPLSLLVLRLALYVFTFHALALYGPSYSTTNCGCTPALMYSRLKKL